MWCRGGRCGSASNLQDVALALEQVEQQNWLMRSRVLSQSTFLLLMAWAAALAAGADLQFRHRFIDRTLPVSDTFVGDDGLTALVDLDRDGDLEFVLGGRPARPSRLYWYEFQAADRWMRHEVGTDYLSDLGLAALDLDRDGWPDLVRSGVWYRNPGQTGQAFKRIVFDESAAGADDVLIADRDGDGKPDVVLMGDERTLLNSLCWSSIPAAGSSSTTLTLW